MHKEEEKQKERSRRERKRKENIHYLFGRQINLSNGLVFKVVLSQDGARRWKFNPVSLWLTGTHILEPSWLSHTMHISKNLELEIEARLEPWYSSMVLRSIFIAQMPASENLLVPPRSAQGNKKQGNRELNLCS